MLQLQLLVEVLHCIEVVDELLFLTQNYQKRKKGVKNMKTTKCAKLNNPYDITKTNSSHLRTTTVHHKRGIFLLFRLSRDQSTLHLLQLFRSFVSPVGNIFEPRHN